MCEIEVEELNMGDHHAVTLSCRKTGKPIIFADMTGEYCEDHCGHVAVFDLANQKRLDSLNLLFLHDPFQGLDEPEDIPI